MKKSLKKSEVFYFKNKQAKHCTPNKQQRQRHDNTFPN